MSNTLAYLYALQDEDYTKLNTTNFKIAVIDPDDANLTTQQVGQLEAAGKNLIAYLSIGEAESYRGYYAGMDKSLILGSNPDWPGNYYVKFWDSGWQKIIIDKAVALAKAGYSGIQLDVVDIYNVDAVANAYGGDARAAMMKFVGAISDATKAINPDFKIGQNNALDLLTVNPDDPSSAPNTAYLAKIDSVTGESTFYMPNNAATSWGNWNAQYLDKAEAAGKTVFTIDYPGNESAQQSFIDKSVSHNFVPFVGNQALDSNIDSTNYQVLDNTKVVSEVDQFLHTITSGGVVVDPTPTPSPTPVPQPTILDPNIIVGTDRDNVINGASVRDEIYGKGGADIIHGNDGHDYIQGDGNNDMIYGDKGNDSLFGGSGNDIVWGGDDNDYIEGNSGSDSLYGGNGNDVIWGGDGSDLIVGGAGDDDLYGNAGYDRFAFYKAAGHDIINDFEGAGAAKGDIIQISSQIYASKSAILSHITYDGEGATIHLDGDNTILVAGIPAGSLTADDFQII